MASSLFPDPLQMWRDAVTKLESDVNALATGSAKSQEVVRTLHQLSGVSLGMEQVLEKVIGSYLRRANLPSRREVIELAESLRRIEDKLDRLLPADSAPAPRPPRTRRPSSGAPAIESATAPAPTPAQESAPASAPARKPARTSKPVGARKPATASNAARAPEAVRAPAPARSRARAAAKAPARTRKSNTPRKEG
jgi:hypothetical protein